MFAIVDMAVNETDQQLISLCAVRTFRVWDLQTFMCLQVCPHNSYCAFLLVSRSRTTDSTTSLTITRQCRSACVRACRRSVWWTSTSATSA